MYSVHYVSTCDNSILFYEFSSGEIRERDRESYTSNTGKRSSIETRQIGHFLHFSQQELHRITEELSIRVRQIEREREKRTGV